MALPLRGRRRFTPTDIFSNASKFQNLKLCDPFEAILPYTHRLTSAKNGVAAERQEAFYADRYFSNASNDPFEAIISYSMAFQKAGNTL
jgi:hypothetical protein